MQAIIMAGGAGTRLRPLTNDVPKPMVKIIDKPVMEYTIRQLKAYDVYDIGVTVNYLHEIIEDYFGDGDRFGVKLTYFVESEPLGTAGSVKQAEEFLDDNFLVMSGDAYTELNLDEFRGAHLKSGRLITMAVKEVENVSGFGVVKVENDIVTDFMEKPEYTTEKLVNAGIYMLKREVLQLIPDGFYDFGRQLFPTLKGKMAAYKTDAYWSDVGTLERYYETNLFVAKRLNDGEFAGQK